MITGELKTLARPYASAAFEYALAHQQLASWEAFLSSAALVAEDKDMRMLLMRPDMTSMQLAALFSEILDKMLDNQKKNFIYLLSENKRLSLLPAISQLFIAYRAEHDKTLTVDVHSAVPLDDSYQQKLVKALTRRLQRQISLRSVVDPSLLGGAIIQAHDWVIDGSVQGKLNRLLESL